MTLSEDWEYDRWYEDDLYEEWWDTMPNVTLNGQPVHYSQFDTVEEDKGER